MTKKFPLLIASLSIVIANSLSAQPSIAIPGAPKGDLPTELMQSRTYCRTLEKHLETIEKQFPSLAIEALAASATWKASPFASGCNNIEAQMVEQMGSEAAVQLAKMDEKLWQEYGQRVHVTTEQQARVFLQMTERRAKGEIEVEMVRANLLCNHKPFQDQPEKEFALGYTRQVTHTSLAGLEIVFQIPMSWKVEDSPKPEIMSFRNYAGHGNIWMTVLVNPTVDATGASITGQEKFEAYSEDSLRAEYERLGIKLNSFTKTKVNSMPALMFTRDQLYEQLGQRATRAAEVIRAFAYNQQISFQINTLGPEGEPIAAERIQKNQALFRMIGGSLKVALK